MKKIDLAWSEKFLERFSKFEFLLVQVIVLLFVFIVVRQNTIISEAYETNAYSSIATQFQRPYGYVEFKDVGGKKFTTTYSGTSYTSPKWTYWPASKVSYTVRVNSSSGAIFKEGSTTADSYGRVKASWSWSYAAAAYPASATNCLAAGSQCKTESFKTNDFKPWAVVGNLQGGVSYRLVVCAPNCGTGTEVASIISVTGRPATLVNPPAMQCNSQGKVSVTFTWTPPSGTTYDLVYLDYSVNEYFAQGYTQTPDPFFPSASTWSDNTFAPAVQYYWRINAKIAGSPNGWVTSATGPFKTPDCSSVVVTCTMADFDRDGSISLSDTLLFTNHLSPRPYNPIYDLNRDNIVDNADYELLNSMFGETCSPLPYAVDLKASADCSILGEGNIVNVKFGWSDATSSYSEQFLDYDVYVHGDSGWPASKATSVGLGRQEITLESFAQDVTYYWRINTKVGSDWYGSAVVNFKTPKCYSVAEPTNFRVGITSTGILPDGTKCTDNNPYGAGFAWDNGSPGFFEVSESPGFESYSRYDISEALFVLSTGENLSPPMKFTPGKSYWWRIYRSDLNKWYSPSDSAFSIGWCNQPSLNNFPSGWPVEHGIVSQPTRCCDSHGGLDAIDIENNTAYTTVDAATPILATIDGYVADLCVAGGTCNYGSLGNAVVIKNQNHSHLLIFGHLSSFNVTMNQTVRAGDVIGGMGGTGRSTGVHLHYEFRGLEMQMPYIPQTGSLGLSW